MIVVDDESRENEGDLILAASLVTPEAMAFIVRHSTGIVCVSMKENDLERLNLPLMVSTKENEEKLCTAFTITVVCYYCYSYLSIILRSYGVIWATISLLLVKSMDMACFSLPFLFLCKSKNAQIRWSVVQAQINLTSFMLV